MYKARSAPHLLSFSFGDDGDPAFKDDKDDEHSDDWDCSYATANLAVRRQQRSNKSSTSDTLHYSDSQTLRRDLEEQGNAFESVLDNAMRRNVARREARDREAEFLFEAPPPRAQLQLRGLPRTKRELYSNVQKLRAIRAENEQRVDELNRAIVLHRSTARRQAARVAKLEEQLEEQVQESQSREEKLRKEVAAAREKLWKMNTTTNLTEKGERNLEETKQRMEEARQRMDTTMALQEKRIAKAMEEQEQKFEQQLRQETLTKFEEQEKKVALRIQQAVEDALRERDAATRAHKQEFETNMEARLNASVAEALRKQKEWMLKEEEKMMGDVKKTEAHLMSDMRVQQMEQAASELSASNSSNEKLIEELRRELVQQQRRADARIQRAEEVHEKEMRLVVEQRTGMEQLKKHEQKLVERTKQLEMKNAMLQAQVVELRNGFLPEDESSGLPLNYLSYEDNNDVESFLKNFHVHVR
jgi:hypothetical protein